MANVSSSNGLEKRPKLRFPGFDEPWKETALSSVLTERNEYAEKDGTYEHATLSKEGIYGKTARYDRDFLVSTENKKYKVTHLGDLCYNPANLKFGVICLNTYGDAIFSPIYVTFEIEASFDPDFIGAYLTRWDFINRALKYQQGTVYERMAVSPEDFVSIKCCFPQKAEQTRLAEFITLLDKRIAAQGKYVESLKKYKRGLLSQLIAQKKAFDTSGEWKTVKLGHIFKERTERAKGNETLLAVTISNGVQRRDEIDLKDNSSDDKSNYKCVYIGDIAYNTMRMWQGASGVSPYNGIVSPAYTIVTPIRPDLHNMTFWAYYFKYSPLVQTFQKYSQGLTSDTWNLKFPQFSEIAVTMPPISEQDKIAECLSVFDEHCKCEDEKLQALLQVRTSLLQQLFI